MTGELNDKLREIVQYCSERQIQVTFTQDPEKTNSIELVDESVVNIQVANYEKDLSDMLENFLKELKNSP